MIGTIIVIFREVLEISIIISVMVAATNGLTGRGKWIFSGIVSGFIGSALIALFAGAISDMAQGLGQELFNALILITASVVIGATALWMSKHAREITHRMRSVGASVIQGDLPFYSISIVIALAVLREGAEVVLFVHGMLASGQTISSIISGVLIGTAGGIALGYGVYAGIISLSPRHVFTVTTWLLIFLCAGMAASSAQMLSSAGWFSNYSYQLWDTSEIISDSSILGRILHALIGYDAKPVAIQLIFYITTFITLITAMKIINFKRPNKAGEQKVLGGN